MTDYRMNIHRTTSEMVDAVSSYLQQRINKTLDQHGHSLVAFPGGKSPMAIFKRLSSFDLKWQNVTIVPTDERVAPAHSTMNNAALINRYLAPSGASTIPLVETCSDYCAAAKTANTRLSLLNWPADIVWLGMGTDGHTASLFPGPDLELAYHTASYATGLMPDPLPAEAPLPRVTLSLFAITAAREIILTIHGSKKRTVLERAIAEGIDSDLPIGRVLACAKCPVTMHWSE